jgi:hypothetical protein
MYFYSTTSTLNSFIQLKLIVVIIYIHYYISEGCSFLISKLVYVHRKAEVIDIPKCFSIYVWVVKLSDSLSILCFDIPYLNCPP